MQFTCENRQVYLRERGKNLTLNTNLQPHVNLPEISGDSTDNLHAKLVQIRPRLIRKIACGPKQNTWNSQAKHMQFAGKTHEIFKQNTCNLHAKIPATTGKKLATECNNTPNCMQYCYHTADKLDRRKVKVWVQILLPVGIVFVRINTRLCPLLQVQSDLFYQSTIFQKSSRSQPWWNAPLGRRL